MIQVIFQSIEIVLNMKDNTRGRFCSDYVASKASVLPQEADANLEGSAPKTPKEKGG